MKDAIETWGGGVQHKQKITPKGPITDMSIFDHMVYNKIM